jgi:hypothetical protein
MLAKAGLRSMSMVALVLSLSAAVQTVRTWSADLVAGRRRLRVAVLILSLLLITVLSGADLTSISSRSYGISGSLLSAIGLLAISALAGWSLFYPPAASPAAVRWQGMRPVGQVTWLRSNPTPMAVAMPLRRFCCVASTA